MRKLRQFLLVVLASAFVFALAAYGQDDAPSLGDVARQSRLQKQQKDAQAKDAQSKDAQNKDAQSKDAPANDAQGKDAQSKDAQGNDDKDATSKDAPSRKTPHVITNDEIPEHVGPTRTFGSGSQNPVVTYAQPAYSEGKAPADYWKSQIQAQKDAIANLKSNIDSLSASIQYAGGNCVSGCVQWNERQKQKQDQVDAMKLQLDQQQKRLEDMQEAARKQGYGSSVYDP
jgi:hypothetical protein